MDPSAPWQPSPAPFRPIPDRFLVAFSFAGEQRELVRAIAEAVEARLGRGSVFLDEWFEHYLAGADADLKLQDIYHTRSTLAVVCVSGRYGGKPWTQAEYEAIRARLMEARASANERDRNAILPIRVGDGDVPGILVNTIAPDVRGRSPEASADLVVERLRLVLPDLNPLQAPPAAPFSPSASARRSALRQALDQLGRQYQAAMLQSVNAIDAWVRVQAEQQAAELERRMRVLERKLNEAG